jgi:hypothetical protein
MYRTVCSRAVPPRVTSCFDYFHQFPYLFVYVTVTTIMKTIHVLPIFLLGMIAVVAPMAAHHSFSAEYDAAATVTLTGVVSKLEWSNPHVHMYVDVMDGNGKITTWNMEGSPPHALALNGFTQNIVNVGDSITITGHRARDNSARASRCEITTAGGKKYNFGGAGEFTTTR